MAVLVTSRGVVRAIAADAAPFWLLSEPTKVAEWGSRDIVCLAARPDTQKALVRPSSDLDLSNSQRWCVCSRPPP